MIRSDLSEIREESVNNPCPLLAELRLSAVAAAATATDFGCCCPICGMPLRPSELEAHYAQELEYLAKLSAAVLLNQKQQVSS